MRGQHLAPLLRTGRAFFAQARPCPWRGGAPLHIVLQFDGSSGCPLISLCNALTLSNALHLPEPGIYAAEELIELILAHIQRRTASLLALLTPSPPPDLAAIVALLLKRAEDAGGALRGFPRGMELDVVPADAQAHSESPATRVFEAAGVKLLHGAVCAPGSAAAVALAGKSELFAESSAFDDPGSAVNQEVLAWLALRPSGGGNLFLSPASLASIQAALHPEQACVIYRALLCVAKCMPHPPTHCASAHSSQHTPCPFPP